MTIELYQAYRGGPRRPSDQVPEVLFICQINQESGWDPTIISPAGAAGIAQIVPQVASWRSYPLRPVRVHGLRVPKLMAANYIAVRAMGFSARRVQRPAPETSCHQYNGIPPLGRD